MYSEQIAGLRVEIDRYMTEHGFPGYSVEPVPVVEEIDYKAKYEALLEVLAAHKVPLTPIKEEAA